MVLMRLPSILALVVCRLAILFCGRITVLLVVRVSHI